MSVLVRELASTETRKEVDYHQRIDDVLCRPIRLF